MRHGIKTMAVMAAGIFLLFQGMKFNPAPERLLPDDAVISFLPKSTGTYNIGRQFFLWTDSSRSDFEGQIKRTLDVWIYYPSDIIKSGSEKILTDSTWREYHTQSIEKRFGHEASEILSLIKTRSVTNSRPFRMQKGFPTLIFAPGYSWLPLDYSIIIEDLVSRGFAVVAFTSHDLSSEIMQPGDNFIGGSPLSDKTYSQTADDFIFIKNKIKEVSGNSSTPFFGVLSCERIGVFGHSAGGAAALMAAGKDSTIDAACNLDGDYPGRYGRNPHQALLYITSQPFTLKDIPAEKWDNEKSEARRKKIWETIKTDSKHPVRIKVPGMYHSNFQDAAIVPKALLAEEVLNKKIGVIDGKAGLFMISDLIASFFKNEFSVEDTPLFSSVLEKYPGLYIPAP